MAGLSNYMLCDAASDDIMSKAIVLRKGVKIAQVCHLLALLSCV